ncbi:hypothetical protein [Cellulomonas persica]
MTATSRTRTRPAPARRRLVATVAACALVALLVGACSPDLPQPDAPPAPAVAPAALTVPQSERVLTSLGEVLTASDEALDPGALAPRVEGPALAMRTAEYVRASATAGAKPPTALPTNALAMVVPQTTDWSRTQLVVTEQPDDLQAQRILVLRQDDPRALYKLWGWARLMPGSQMPATAPADAGSETLAADDTSLLLTPTDALTQFMDVAANGAASQYAASFAASPLVQEMEDLRAEARSGIGSAGTAATSYEMDPNPATALRTVDGGAIVTGTFTAVSRMTVTLDGATIGLSNPFYAALAGATSAAHESKRTFTGIVVLYVPPAGSQAQVQVLAGELVVTGVTAS